MASDAQDVTRVIRDRKNRDKNVEAKERNQYRKGLTNAQQIIRLNNRLGEGIGAKLERARISSAGST